MVEGVWGYKSRQDPNKVTLVEEAKVARLGHTTIQRHIATKCPMTTEIKTFILLQFQRLSMKNRIGAHQLYSYGVSTPDCKFKIEASCDFSCIMIIS
jgi:hypothetical protein